MNVIFLIVSMKGTTMEKNILIAEDEPDIIELLSLYLENEGYTIFPAEDGEKALEIFNTEKITIAVVDIMLPKVNGYDLIKSIRHRSNIPIIILSAKNLDADRILGLNIGADAYITKPFNPLEVLAYINAQMRRYYELGSESVQSNEPSFLKVGELELDTESFTLKKSQIPIQMTTTELKILAKLMKTPDRIFTKTQLYECINGELYKSDENTMMVHISNIRSKIEDDPANPKYIKTVRGLGYKIESKETE